MVKKAFLEAEIFVSPSLLMEYREVPIRLESAGKINHFQLKALISGIASFVTRVKIVQPKKELRLCRDPKDNMVLECCLSARADYLISSDRDLLEIEHLPFNLKIINPRKYLD